MQRCIFRAQCRDAEAADRCFQNGRTELKRRMEAAGAACLSLFRWNKQLFLYYENASEAADPHELFPEADGVLEAWPGEAEPRRWVPMMDIFHYQEPMGPEHWARRNPERRPFGRIARLKPEMVSSYVYYHYQYQEEQPGDGDKYGIIGLHESLMFFYAERPSTVEPAPYRGKLGTSLRPKDWAGVMDPHFIKWTSASGEPVVWLELGLILEEA